MPERGRSPAHCSGLPLADLELEDWVTNYGLLKAAVLSKRPVVAMYDGYRREFCPHAIGMKNGEEYCLAYQFGGQGSKGNIVPGQPKNWRCFVVARLSQVSLRDGEWHSAATLGRMSPCLDSIDVEVDQ